MVDNDEKGSQVLTRQEGALPFVDHKAAESYDDSHIHTRLQQYDVVCTISSVYGGHIPEARR